MARVNEQVEVTRFCVHDSAIPRQFLQCLKPCSIQSMFESTTLLYETSLLPL